VACGVTPAVDTGLAFAPLHYADRVHVVNPHGDVGVVTLWSPYRTVERKLRAEAPTVLDPARSRVAAVANLYGDGLFAMLANLLHNPQIRHLVALGQDLGLGTCDEIAAFLADGVEEGELLGRPVRRIAGTTRLLPDAPGFDVERLRSTLSFHALGRLGTPGLADRLTALLDDLPRLPPAGPRVAVALPDPAGDVAFRPSEPQAHQVVRRSPLDCWEELVVRTMRFGRPVELDSGPRRELLNAKAVVTGAADDPDDALERYGFDPARFRAYQREILDPVLPEGIAYTYGNRLRGHFPQGEGTDALATVAARLRAEPRTRRAYVTLWDDTADLAGPDDRSTPCLTTLWFRLVDDRLALTATYRAHNLLTAWLMNVYGLAAIQAHVAEGAGLPAGPITVVSHSLGIDPRSSRLPVAEAVAAAWTRDDDVDRRTGKASLREDPNGYFEVSADAERGVVVADHRFAGVLVKRYEAERATTVEQQVAADMAVTLPSHAMWLGRQLTLAEQRLRGGA
jgi:hypothetical protein